MSSSDDATPTAPHLALVRDLFAYRESAALDEELPRLAHEALEPSVAGVTLAVERGGRWQTAASAGEQPPPVEGTRAVIARAARTGAPERGSETRCWVVPIASHPRRALVLRSGLEGVGLEGLRDLASMAEAAYELARLRPLAPGEGSSRAHPSSHPPPPFTFDDLVGDAPAFAATLADARRIASADLPVLITGESGTGKELLAQAMHNASARADHPFVAVNVAAVPRSLLEGELFGHEAGAFTGAHPEGRPGYFEQAGAGTLLLDEIGDMPLGMQARLLRVLQERAVVRLGGSEPIPVQAQIIAATHRHLEQAVGDGSFRLDLYYRLRGVQLRLPPLRERRGDVPLLVAHHLRRCAREQGRPELTLAPRLLSALERHEWPGNVRELAHLVEAAVSLAPPDATELRELPAPLREGTSSAPPAAERGGPGDSVVPLGELERRAIENALGAFDGNVAKASRALGVSRATLYRKMARFGLR